MTTTRTEIAGRYRLDQQIGKGGMGIVYRAEDAQTGEPVAVKLLKPEVVTADPEQVERFIREGEALSQLNHPNIVKMLAATQENGDYYLVMEYVTGGSLLDALNDAPQFSVQRALYIALDLADALTRAHRLSILHRDIKPANVLLAADGTPRLTDFGMARIGEESNVTQQDTIVGTLAYLAPEAFSGEPPSERTDIWAFGIMLYEMLAGNRPFAQSSAANLINNIMIQPVPSLEDARPDLPTALIDLVGRMLERDPHARIPSVRLVGVELDAIIRGDTSSMQHIISPDTTGRFDTKKFETVDAGPTSQPLPTHNLPPQPTQFIGRADELAALAILLNDPKTPLITLLGPGGIGKTRLSIAAAEQQQGNQRDGIFFVPLAPIENADFLVPTIAENIGFTFSGAGEPQDELLNYLQEKQMLLVLDNFEHIIDGADCVAALLKAAPGVKLLVSSRERLRLRGEQLFEVSGMKQPSLDCTVSDMLKHPSVLLFRQSAQRTTPHFEINDDNAGAVKRVLELVQGLPLAIELAAAWLEMLDVDEIVTEIENGLDFLETDLRDIPDRHRSIRAVFEYSWTLMTDDERDVFMCLSIFRGGFEREAGQKIADAGLRTLTNLVNKSLLQRDPAGRYRLHRLMRQYAAEKFDGHPMEAEIHRRHAEYYGNMLDKLGASFNTPRETDALKQMDAELENFRLALHWAIENGMWAHIAQVKHTVMLYYIGCSMLNEGATLFKELTESLVTQGRAETPLYYSSRLREAWLRSRMGDYDCVISYAREAAAFFSGENDEEHAHALNLMSYAAMMTGDYPGSIDYCLQALDLITIETAKTAWFMAMGNMGYAEYLRGDYAKARQIYEDVTSRYEHIPYSPSGIAYGYNNLGEIVREEGQLDRAMELFHQAYEIFASFTMKRGMAFTLNNIAGIHQTRGNIENARQMYEEAYRYYREIGDRRGIGHSLSALGNLASFDGDYDRAQGYFEQSLEIRRQMGEQGGIADSLLDLGRVAVNREDYDRAMTLFEEGEALYRQIGDRSGIGLACGGRGMMHLMKDEIEDARQCLNIANEIAEETNSGWLRAQSSGGLAMIALREGDFDRVREYGFIVLSSALENTIMPMVLVSIGVMARVEALEGDVEQALELIGMVRERRSMYINAMYKELDTLYDELRAELPAGKVEALLARGAQRDPYEVGRQLLNA